jgi:hypothetical protein
LTPRSKRIAAGIVAAGVVGVAVYLATRSRDVAYLRRGTRYRVTVRAVDTHTDAGSVNRPTAMLYQGTRYRATAALPFVAAVISADTARTKLAEKGFGDVKWWTDASELPTDWPSERRDPGAGTFSVGRFVEATWSKPDATLDVPPQVTAAWAQGGAGHEAAGDVEARLSALGFYDVHADATQTVDPYVWTLTAVWTGTEGQRAPPPDVPACRIIHIREAEA